MIRNTSLILAAAGLALSSPASAQVERLSAPVTGASYQSDDDGLDSTFVIIGVVLAILIGAALIGGVFDGGDDDDSFPVSP